MTTRLSSPAASEDFAARILIVANNPTNLQVLLQTLDGRGHELLAATNGEDALRIAGTECPALVLLDVMMPGIDGYEVCRRLKADPATEQSAVIFLAALGDVEDRVRGLDLGAVDYIAKPFQAEEVVARVDTHLAIQRLQHDLAARNRELERANARLQRDLDTAARMQSRLLPDVSPPMRRAQFAWEYRPCDQLAGDSLNVLRIDDRHVCVYVVDVSGNGVPAALLSAAITRSLSLRTNPSSLVTEPGADGRIAVVEPSAVAERLNAAYPMNETTRQYFTLVYGILDTSSGRFSFVCSGHPGSSEEDEEQRERDEEMDRDAGEDGDRVEGKRPKRIEAGRPYHPRDEREDADGKELDDA